MIGRTVAHFEIQEKLGQGGMGVVYKAHDSKLNRTVALKFLPAQFSSDPSAKARFIQEAQAASALDHANICSIYEIGETGEGEVFIAMAYYDGQTLKYRLSEEQFSVESASDVARQIARALERAHEAGIIHRDVKPANIMLTNRGEVKLLDFGLAKLAGGAELTMAGSTLGTAAYMSPEQARGSQVTTATDIWALGAVMYEMFTGQKPFSGEYDQALLYGILNEDPRPANELRPEVPTEISDMVQRCLSKTPGERPSPEEIVSHLGGSSSSMAAVVAEPFAIAATTPQPAADTSAATTVRGPTFSRRVLLGVGIAVIAILVLAVWFLKGSVDADASRTGSSSVSKSTAGADRSVAVLPFKLFSATDPEASVVFAGGMHDDVLAQLAKIGELKVIARTSVMQYENTTKTIHQIAEELNVASVMEGTIQRSGNRVRVNVSLVDGESESPLWSESYDEELTAENIFNIQTDLARSIAGALQATLSPQEEVNLADRPEIPMEAYDLYTQAMYVFRSTAFGARADESATMMRQALEIEPDYAQAHAGLANILLRAVENGLYAPDEVSEEIQRNIDDAIRLDPSLSDAYVARGTLATSILDWQAAEDAYLKALELSPGNAAALRRYAQVLYQTGRGELALESARKAVESDPLTTGGRRTLADILFSMKRYQDSIDETAKIVQMDPDLAWSFYNLGYAYAMLGRLDDAIPQFEEARRLDGNDPYNTMGLAWAHAMAGHRDEAMSIMDSVADNAAVLREKAIIHGILGNLDTAFDMLDRAFAENPGTVAIIAGDASVPEAMRNDPRFKALVDKIGY